MREWNRIALQGPVTESSLVRNVTGVRTPPKNLNNISGLGFRDSVFARGHGLGIGPFAQRLSANVTGNSLLPDENLNKINNREKIPRRIS